MQNRNSLIGLSFCLGAAAAIRVTPAAAQRHEPSAQWERECQRGWGDRDRDRFCTTFETTVPRSGGTLVVDGRVNGGVTVVGTSRRDVLVIARIQTNAGSAQRAEAIAKAIKIRTDGGMIYAEGPDTRGREWCSVSFEVEVPAQADLDLVARNGGIAVSGVNGTLRMETLNGGVDIDFPVTVQGKIGRRISTDLGRGGATIRIVTMNGGVDIRNRK